MVDDESAAALASIPYYDDSFSKRRLYTAWDSLGDEKRFFTGIATLERHGVPPTNVLAYMLVGYDKREDWGRVLYRFEKMRALGIRPFPMIYGDRNRTLPLGDCPQRIGGRTLGEFQRWAIRRYYTVASFEDYDAGVRHRPRAGGNFVIVTETEPSPKGVTNCVTTAGPTGRPPLNPPGPMTAAERQRRRRLKRGRGGAGSRGRPPIGRRAMTPAQRQARRRKRLREAEAERLRLAGQEPPRLPYQPPHGYGRAKEWLIKQGHEFTRVHDELGQEFGGTFIDGAYVDTLEVIRLAAMPAQERKQRLDEARRDGKHWACDAVEVYMKRLRVSLDELIANCKLNAALDRTRGGDSLRETVAALRAVPGSGWKDIDDPLAELADLRR
jgi:hypothetical protein